MTGSVFRLGLLACLVLAFAAGRAAHGEVVGIDILERALFAGGQTFGETGAYEKIEGRLHYAVDPGNPYNSRIIDLARAPRDGRGRVTFTGDFILLKPLDLERGNRRLLYDVNNRGNLVALSALNEAVWSNRPETPAHAGNGFLMEQGYALLWSAWNWDVLPGAGRLQIDLPVATESGQSITGMLAAEIVVESPAAVAPLAWGNSRGYPPANPEAPSALLTVREAPEAERRPIPREAWRFVMPEPEGGEPVSIAYDGGFSPGLIYEAVYTAKDPRVVGLGLAAIRDALSFFRYALADEAGHPNPLLADRAAGPAPDPEATLIFGVSQSGRVIQHMIWEALHFDEAGRPVFDAAFVHVAGGGKGSFNHRFAQTTRHPSPWEDRLYPADFFPFATTSQEDPVSGQRGSVLDEARAAGSLPYIFYTGTSTEYWTRSASLLHTDVTGMRDLPLDPQTRVYVLSGAQHGNYAQPWRGDFAYCGNPADHRPVLRALLVALDRWATEGVEPPNSVYPRIGDNTLGTVARYLDSFPWIPDHPLPTVNLQPPRLDLGPRFALEGIADFQPARPGAPFVALVALPDSDGNDRGGIRLPAVEVPLGTYLGWNLRLTGGPGRLGRWEGAFLPFAITEKQRRARNDPRASLEARYGSQAQFLRLTSEAADSLVERGFLLPADVEAIVQRAGNGYDAVTTGAGGGSCAYLAAW